MPFDLESLKTYSKEYNIVFKGALHVGSHNLLINATYNLLNIHNNNIIWTETDLDKALYNQMNNIPNVFTTTIDESTSGKSYSNLENLHCPMECCLESPKLVVSEINSYKIQGLSEFLEHNNFDPSEYNLWNFDCMGAEYRIFKGSEHLLKFADVIYTGVNSTEITKNSNTNSEIDVLLEAHGLRRVETVKNDDNWCMALYVRI